jgi:hypothetical protein
LLINGLLAHPKCIESRDLSHDRTRDGSGDLLLIRSCETRSPDGLARAPCFSGSRAGLITGFTYGTFDLELVILDVVDCVCNTVTLDGQVSFFVGAHVCMFVSEVAGSATDPIVFVFGGVLCSSACCG